jgi:hypothetical protein
MAEEAKKKGPELHEVLAVQGDLEANAKRVLKEGIDTFVNREAHFSGHERSLRMFQEKDQHLEAAHAEHQELTTTVGAKLKYVQGPIGKHWDCIAQKERTNQEARADVIVDGKVIAKDVAVGALIAYERELKEYRTLVDSIKTLAPGKKWELDDTLTAADGSKGVYRDAFLDKKLKTVQTIAHKILVPANEQHPAQIEKWKENEPVGEFTQQTLSGKITPAEKSKKLAKVSALIAGVKKARMRANKTPVVKVAVSKAFFGFIHGDEDLSEDE